MDKYISKEAIIEELEEEIEMGDAFDEKDVLINKGLKIALKDIKRQPVADVQPVKWIKCSERMPSLGEGRIVMTETLLGVIDCKTVIPVRYVRTEVRGKSVERWEWLSGCVCHDNITHWMPLPEPPKDGDTNG